MADEKQDTDTDQDPAAKRPGSPKSLKGDRQHGTAASLMDPAKDSGDPTAPPDGEALYTAYRKAAEGKSHRGEPLPHSFEDLSDERREVWHRTAEAFTCLSLTR